MTITARSIGLIGLAVMGGFGLTAASISQASAADSLDFGTALTVGAGAGLQGIDQPDSAPYQAPTKAPLDATQPTSVISQQYIENNVPLSGNYDNVIKIAPSVYAVSPNGPGLMENQILSIRGFQDGQFNVTFDGIPWGDSNDFTHHSTSYFMDHDLGEVSVDRGPGTAATVGYATFGGTVAVQSKDPLAAMTATPYGGYGSFNTGVYGAEFDSGSLAKFNGMTAFIDVEGLDSDGYLTNAGQSRQNIFLKILQPVGTNTLITAVATYNNIRQYVSLGATGTEIAQLGANWGLSSNPNSQDYFGYNQDKIHTDFEYIGVQSYLGDGWKIDNKTYSYAYFHRGLNGEDPNGINNAGGTPNLVELTPGGAQTNGVPGQVLQNDYRSIGDIFRLQKEVAFGDIQAGFWYDHQINSRSLAEVDMSNGLAANYIFGGTPTSNIDRELHQSLDTVEPYLQVDYKPSFIPGLTVSPGLKYALFVRTLDAQVNTGTGLPLNTSQSYDAPLPSLLIHYKINPNWVAYAQVAEGFLAPNQNILNTTNPAFSHVSPQQSWNYQIGTSWQSKEFSASVDAYYVDFSNLIGHQTVGGITEFFNQGGVTYTGVEAEATYFLGYGLSVYGNGSLNNAVQKGSGNFIADTPNATAALGLIYNKDNWYASLIDKWVGETHYIDGNNVEQRLSPFNTLDASIGYTFANMPKGVPQATIKLQAENLLNATQIFAFAGTTLENQSLFWTIPGRSFFVNVSVPF